jgi:PPP family 3-phenylpropionic acid transporter
VGGVFGALAAGQLWHFGGSVAFLVSGCVALLGAMVAWYWLVRPYKATSASQGRRPSR